MDNIIENFRLSLNDMLSMREMNSVQLGKELGIDPSVVRRWLNKGVDVRLRTLIRLVNYFNCSIEYLCGKTHESGEFKMQAITDFGERLLVVMKEVGVKPFQLFHDTSIIPSKYYYWLSGGEPNLTSLEILAEYLNVTLDYLVGRANREIE